MESFFFNGCGRGGEASLYEDGDIKVYIYIDGDEYRFETKEERLHFLEPQKSSIMDAASPFASKAKKALEVAWRQHMDTVGVIPPMYLDG